MKTFINEQKITALLKENRDISKGKLQGIIEKSKKLKGLTPKETASLLQCEDKKLIREMFEAARYVKESIYGKRLVLFAPLYISNYCSNSCLYCGFRKQNTELKRKRLSLDEIKNEIEALEEEGHKRILLVAGEDDKASRVGFLAKTIKTIYAAKTANASIRRVNVNTAPMSISDFKRLKRSGIGTYQLFQETYHRKTYCGVHPSGAKGNYEWRLYAMDRAQEAGIDDVGLGVLFGLYNYKFEVLALLAHSMHLEKTFGAGPHTISVPRIKPALNAPLSRHVPYPVSDDEFKKIVAIIRLAVPYTGIILSTREKMSLRNELFSLGVSQISAGSRSNPGGYTGRDDSQSSQQFELEDTRSQLEVVKDMLEKGFFPSFCTACYRVGRTGKAFMDLAKPGEIKKFCLPNCILTFKEYVLDYGDGSLKKDADSFISRELAEVSDVAVKEKIAVKLKELETGKRDIFF